MKKKSPGFCIAFAHNKGGTGKTTACLNIAGWLSKMEKKVLVIDLDPKGNATAGLGIDFTDVRESIADVFFKQKDITEIILETESGVYCAPSSLELLQFDRDVFENAHAHGIVEHPFHESDMNAANDPTILRNELKTIKRLFDYILIDVPANGLHLMNNGLAAADKLYIPMDSGVFACESLQILANLLQNIEQNTHCKIERITFLLKEFSDSILDWGLMRQVRKLIKHFNQSTLEAAELRTIPYSRKILEAQLQGQPISHYAPHSSVGKAYRSIASEILSMRRKCTV